MRKRENKIMQYISLLVGLFLSAVAFNLFFRSTKIAYGGTNGISVIVELMTGGKVSADVTITVFYVLMFVVGWFLLSKATMAKSLLGTIVYPIFVSATGELANLNFLDIQNHLLIIYIFGAIIAGVGSGLTYRSGFSGGGTDILRLMMFKYLKIPLGKAGIVINGVIVVLGAVLTGNYGNVLYAFLILYIMGVVTDRIILGVSSAKMFYIITKEEEKVRDYIVHEIGHGVTILSVDNHTKHAILCVVPTRQYFTLKEKITMIDPNIFFLVTDSYEVSGGV